MWTKPWALWLTQYYPALSPWDHSVYSFPGSHNLFLNLTCGSINTNTWSGLTVVIIFTEGHLVCSLYWFSSYRKFALRTFMHKAFTKFRMIFLDYTPRNEIVRWKRQWPTWYPLFSSPKSFYQFFYQQGLKEPVFHATFPARVLFKGIFAAKWELVFSCGSVQLFAFCFVLHTDSCN